MKNIQFIVIVALVLASIAAPYFIAPKRKKCGCSDATVAIEETEVEE